MQLGYSVHVRHTGKTYVTLQRQQPQPSAMAVKYPSFRPHMSAFRRSGQHMGRPVLLLRYRVDEKGIVIDDRPLLSHETEQSDRHTSDLDEVLSEAAEASSAPADNETAQKASSSVAPPPEKDDETREQLLHPVEPHNLRAGSLTDALQTPNPPVPSKAGSTAPQISPEKPSGGGPQQPVALGSVDADEYEPSGFSARRLLCFIGITAGYMGLYFTRGSLTYCAPVLLADPSLGMSITDIGAMTSAFPIAYGISKFAGGVLGARFSARWMLGGGLLLTALVNITFGFAHSVGAFTALWFLNGSLQGIGAPASASLLTRWFPSKERGTYWGLWNTGANIGGFLTPLIVGYVANHYGWQMGMWVPGALGLSVALFCLATVRDTPQEAGFTVPGRERQQSPAEAAAKGSVDANKKGNTAIKDAFTEVVKNKGIWLLALTYFFVYIVRQGATSWLMMYLMQVKGVGNAAQAAMTVSGLELGGLVGGTLAGMLSDARIRNVTKASSRSGDGGTSADIMKEGGNVGRRVQIVMGYICCTMLALVALRTLPAGNMAMQWITIAALGFTIYGPHMLIGLCGAELVPKAAVGASQGVLGIVAYFGAANAGIPLAYVLKHSGWDGYFVAMTAACCCALVLLAPLANARSHVQEMRLAKAD